MILEIHSLQDYYDYIETQPLYSYNNSPISALIQYRDFVNDEDEKATITFELSLNELFNKYCQVSGNLKKAHISKSSFLDLNDNYPERLKARAIAVINPQYKAVYYHILWDSKIKHIDFAKNAVDSYLYLLQSVPLSLEGNGPNHLFERAYQNAFTLSQLINYRKQEIIDLLSNQLDQFILIGYKKYSLMRYVIEYGKKLPTELLQKYFDYANHIVNDIIYPEFQEDFINLLISLSQRLSLPQRPYFIKLGDYRLLQATNSSQPFVQYGFLESAMEQFQKAGESNRLEEVASLIEQTKKKLEFKKIEFSFEDDLLHKWWDFQRDLIEVIADQYSSEMCLEYLVLDAELLPSAQLLDNPIVPVSFQLVNVRNFDINRNTDNQTKVGVNAYHIHIHNFTCRKLVLLFSKIIKNGKLTFDSLMQYFRSSTWLGQNFQYSTNDDEQRGFDWIEMIGPGFEIFLEQSAIDIELQINDHKAYIPAVDSLVLKFEGLLREFSKAIGAQTIEKKDDGLSERISFEKLLENDRIKAVIPPNDIAFFRYLFTSSGMNLRNNIAHCFYNSEKYSAILLMLLTVAFLRLSAYKFKVVTSETNIEQTAD